MTYPYGMANAVEGMGAIAAPLLAGFSLTLIALVIDKRDDLRWPDHALLCLAFAAVMLIAAVQCNFWARQYVVTPTQIQEWWPDFDDPDIRQQVRGQQWSHQRQFDRWSNRARRTYAAGILALSLAVTLVLVPKSPPLGNVAIVRLGAITVALVGFIGELLWIISTWRGWLSNDEVSEAPPERWQQGDHPGSKAAHTRELQELREEVRLEEARRQAAEKLAEERSRTIDVSAKTIEDDQRSRKLSRHVDLAWEAVMRYGQYPRLPGYPPRRSQRLLCRICGAAPGQRHIKKFHDREEREADKAQENTDATRLDSED